MDSTQAMTNFTTEQQQLQNNERLYEVAKQIGYIQKTNESLEKALKEHMEYEEDKYQKIYRWLIGLTFITVLSLFDVPARDIFMYAVKLL